MTNKNKFPVGWDEKRIKKLLAFYEEQSEDEAALEDELAFADSPWTVMNIPQELVPAVRVLLASYNSGKLVTVA